MKMAPPPPPPPMMPSAKPAAGNNQRGLLLQSIREGTKLKKTVTVDKSAPYIPGKTSSVTSNNSINNESSRDVVSNSAHRNHMNVNGGCPPGLGSLFTHGIPKLKPTGLSIGSARENPTTRGLSTETKTRGPPPQPPPASQKPSILSSASDSTLASVNGTSRPAPPVLPSKPPVGGYGKPNVAPKPPVAKEPVSPNQSSLHSQTSGIGGSLQTLNDNRAGSSQNLSILGQINQLNKPSPPPKKLSVNGRPGVNRAQSMRAPRSPPVAPTTTPPFPPNIKQSLVKNQSSLHQSQDSLNSRNLVVSKTGTLPHNFIQKVAQQPPNTPPPPTPSQSHRGTPTRPPVSRPPPPPSRPPAPSAPPPPPPHRTGHAPPPPAPPIDRLTPSVASNSGPPAPPTRNSSMRNGVPSYLTEIETRFSHLFHSVHEFPEPGVYRRVIKNYNTKASANAKQPAPQPPVHSQSSVTHVQLNNKMWVNNTSQC